MQSRSRLPVQLVPITTKMSSSNPVRGEVNSIQHYVIKFVEYPIINDKNVLFFFSSNVRGTNDDTFTEFWTSVHAFFSFFSLVTWSLNQAKSCSAFSLTFSIRMSTSYSEYLRFCLRSMACLTFFLSFFFFFFLFPKMLVNTNLKSNGHTRQLLR